MACNAFGRLNVIVAIFSSMFKRMFLYSIYFSSFQTVSVALLPGGNHSVPLFVIARHPLGWRSNLYILILMGLLRSLHSLAKTLSPSLACRVTPSRASAGQRASGGEKKNI